MTNSTVLITGSGGVLGTALLKLYQKQPHLSVIAVTSQLERLIEENKEYRHIEIVSSVNTIKTPNNIFCINCAFPRSSEGHKLADFFETTISLINHLSKLNLKHFINISSQSVYAQFGDEIPTERGLVNPGNLYGMAKYAIEKISEQKCSYNDYKYTCIRLGSLASDIFDQRMINRFFHQIKTQKRIQVDKGQTKISYLHVDDAANALVAIADMAIQGYEIEPLYNLGNNDWETLLDLANLCNRYAEAIGIPTTEIILSEKYSDYNNAIDSSELYNRLNWQPAYNMEKLVEVIFDKLENP